MKNIPMIVGLVLASILVGCSSTSVVLAPVGPNPLGGGGVGIKGELQVFSRLAKRSDNQNQAGDDPVWYQHTDYDIYNQHRKLVEHVDNTIGHYDETPRLITLPVGKYFVKAFAKDYLLVKVPVLIEPGRITKVHLDYAWQPPADTGKTELVSAPVGYPVGWRADFPDSFFNSR